MSFQAVVFELYGTPFEDRLTAVSEGALAQMAAMVPGRRDICL